MHIVNVNIGPYARIKGVSRLRNGSVISCKEDPVEIGMFAFRRAIYGYPSQVDTADCRDEDFNAVRGGGFDDNPFVQEVIDHIRRKSALGDGIIARLK